MNDAFKVIKNGKTLDYRIGQDLNLTDVEQFFKKSYEVKKLWSEKRHVVGILEKENKKYFLKLATTEGISIRFETEKIWDEEFNKHNTKQNFKVPKIFESGYYNKLLYFVTDFFEGEKLAELTGKTNKISDNLELVLDFAEHIQTLPLTIPVNDAIMSDDHQEWFRLKTKSWLDSIPKDVYDKFELDKLWRIVVEGSNLLQKRPRHGDFTPWHIILPGDSKLGLIDGEHAHSLGVEYYDICYFIQRVYSVLEDEELASKIFHKLLSRGYDKSKLKTVLLSRAIGGFLDESFKPSPNYQIASDFAKQTQVIG